MDALHLLTGGGDLGGGLGLGDLTGGELLDLQALELPAARGALVVDPFAGGGSIPLEASRLGCGAFGSDSAFRR